MKFSLTLRQIELLSRLAHGAQFARGLGKLFPFDSRANRFLTAMYPLAHGLNNVAALGLARTQTTWKRHYAAKAIIQGIERYGTRLFVLNEDFSNATEVWQIGEHVVLWQRDWGGAVFASASTTAEVATELFSRASADIGRDSRVMVTGQGFAPDSETAPESMAAPVAVLCERLRAEMRHRNRSVLLYGPAGAGKTAASRQLVEALADSCVVVTSELLTPNIFDANTNPFDLICMWRPGAVIFDDIDRAMDHNSDAHLIAGISRVRAVVPLVIGTANTRRNFSGAVVRPGRFDRALLMDRLDPAIVRRRLCDVPEYIRERAVEVGLLGAYVDELAFRIATGDDPDASLHEMIARQNEAGDGYARIEDTLAAAAE
jgi:hypothetical protein